MTLNHILLLLTLLAFPHGLPDHRFMLQFVLTVPPQDHEPSISSTISFPICEPLSISPTSYRNSPMGPPPFISFHDIYASPGAFINHWDTRFCIFYIFPTFIFCTNTCILQSFTFVVTVGGLPSFWPHATHVTLGWSIPSHFPLLTSSISSEHDPGHLPLSSAFIYLVPPLAQLTSDLVVPMTLDLVPTVAAMPYIMHPPTKGSLESSHFFDFAYVPLPFHHLSRFHRVPFCFSESRLPFVDISILFQKGDSILVLIPHSMSDLGWHKRKHHSPLISLTPITFDANTFSCCGGSYFATIAVFIIICRRPLNLVGPPLPTSLSLFTSATITTGSEYVPMQNCLLPLSFRP
jgi:hypothetical protein